MESLMSKFKTTRAADTHDSLEPLRASFPAGETIFKEGDLGLAMYVIEAGEVVIRKSFGGEERELAKLGKGDFFGEMCMLEEESPRSATAVAVTDVDVVTIDQSAFTFILKHNPEIAIRMMRKLALRLKNTTTLLEEAVGQKVDLDHSGVTERPPADPDPTTRLVEITTGTAFPLADKKDTTIGRMDPVTGIHPDVDLSPVDNKRSISRRHARLRREDDGGLVLIEDVGTMNGTFVNGVRVSAGRPFPVKPGDSLVFGTIQCRLEVEGAEAAAE